MIKMPNVHVALPETQQNIFRPIALEITKQVQETTAMKDVEIYFPGDETKIQTSGSGIDSATNNFVETNSKRRNLIVVEETIDEENLSPTFFNPSEYSPVFVDQKLKIVITPIYAKHNVVINFNYRCGSKNESIKWLQDMRMKISRIKKINTHTVNYHYNIPKELLNVIKVIHQLREEQDGYGESLEDYIKSQSTPRLTRVTDLVGEATTYAVREQQTEILGEYDFDSLPSRPEKDEDSGMWIISFGYNFNYDKPIGINLRYPISVHNLPLPLELVSFTSELVKPSLTKLYDLNSTQRAQSMFRQDIQMQNYLKNKPELVIPEFDDTQLNSLSNTDIRVGQFLTTIGEDDRRTLLNLNELGSHYLDNDLLLFIKDEINFINKPGQSLISVNFFIDGVLQNYRSIEILEDLTIRAVKDLSLRKVYHLTLEVKTDLAGLKQEAVNRIRNHQSALKKIIFSINQSLREKSTYINSINLDTISYPKFNHLVRVAVGKEAAQVPNPNNNPSIPGISIISNQRPYQPFIPHLNHKAPDIKDFNKILEAIFKDSKVNVFNRRVMFTGILVHRKE